MNEPRKTLRGFVINSANSSFCQNCPGACCTGLGKFGYSKISLFDHEAENPAFAHAVERNADGSPFLPITPRCQFLKPGGKCGIYQNRPEACRASHCMDEVERFQYHTRADFWSYEPWLRHLRRQGIDTSGRDKIIEEMQRLQNSLHARRKLRLLKRGTFVMIGVWWHDRWCIFHPKDTPSNYFHQMLELLRGAGLRLNNKDRVVRRSESRERLCQKF